MKSTPDNLELLSDPHGALKELTAGPAAESARATLVLIHGRGDSAEGILSIAPEAAGHTWYPHSFLAPLESNQPYLDSALKRIESIVKDLLARGIANERIAFLGFSQGACLTTEFLARHPRRYGAAMALTGGLIGPPGTKRDYPGSLGGTPVFLGTSDPDPHVPFERVRETEAELNRMGAQVELRRYPGMPHTINQDEIDVCRGLLRNLISHD
jgi:predicted esterase